MPSQKGVWTLHQIYRSVFPNSFLLSSCPSSCCMHFFSDQPPMKVQGVCLSLCCMSICALNLETGRCFSIWNSFFSFLAVIWFPLGRHDLNATLSPFTQFIFSKDMDVSICPQYSDVSTQPWKEVEYLPLFLTFHLYFYQNSNAFTLVYEPSHVDL